MSKIGNGNGNVQKTKDQLYFDIKLLQHYNKQQQPNHPHKTLTGNRAPMVSNGRSHVILLTMIWARLKCPVTSVAKSV